MIHYLTSAYNKNNIMPFKLHIILYNAWEMRDSPWEAVCSVDVSVSEAEAGGEGHEADVELALLPRLRVEAGRQRVRHNVVILR